MMLLFSKSVPLHKMAMQANTSIAPIRSLSTILGQKSHYLAASVSTVTHYQDTDIKLWKQSTGSSIFHSSKRSLFDDSNLGITRIDNLRQSRGNLFVGEARNRFIERLKNYIDAGQESSVIKDDLINLASIVESVEELDLLEKVMKIVVRHDPDSKPKWGALLLRLYCKMGLIDRAVENVLNEAEFGGLFDSKTAMKILLTMVFKAERYGEVLDLYKIANAKFHADDEHNLLLVPFCFAALAKLGTPEALAEAKNVFSKLGDGQNLQARSRGFISYLALKNNDYRLAIDIFNPVRSSLVGRSLSLEALYKMERFEDVLVKLRSYVHSLRRTDKVILRQTSDLLRSLCDKIENNDLSQELSDILVELDSEGQLADMTLEDLVFKDYTFKLKPLQDQRDNRGSQGFAGKFGRYQYRSDVNTRHSSFERRRVETYDK